MQIVLDYPTLRVIWWTLLGVLLIGFALTDGRDLGIAALLPFIARNETERRMAINVAGPSWDGDQAWFILGGGAIFAAWPFVYAVSCSGFYLAMFLVLAALILRPVGFKYRSKRPEAAWRARWDWALFFGGFVPSLVFGVAVGNVLQGIPFRLDGDLRTFYEGSFLGLFTAFALLCGVLSVAMMVLHGPVHERTRRFGGIAAPVCLALFAAGGAYVALGPIGYAVQGLPDPSGASNPLRATVAAQAGAWLGNLAAIRG
nr:cytochrome d ubiquinol oxidase subunit II [uncultured Lichenicoccus sp.]